MNADIRIQFLETPRLTLRPYVSEDAERLTELLQDQEIHRWTSSIPYPYSIEDARDFLGARSRDDATGASFAWAITLRETGDLMGAMGLHGLERDRGTAELGYWMGEGSRGQGYATEAARRVISWCFEDLELYRVQATHLPGNFASAAVMRNIGMQKEGLLRGFGWKNGEHSDLYMYAVLRADATWMSTEDQSGALSD